MNAAYQGNLAACHFGHANHRFLSPGLDGNLCICIFIKFFFCFLCVCLFTCLLLICLCINLLFIRLFLRFNFPFLYLFLFVFSYFYLFLLIINLFIHLYRYFYTYLTPHSGRLTFVLPCIPCIGCWVVLRAGMDGSGKPLPSPGFSHLNVQLVAGRYTDCFVPAHRCIWSIILAYGTDRLSRNVGTYQSTLRNIPEEGRSLFHHGRNLKPRIIK